MVTRRSTRSFVEEELVSAERECPMFELPMFGSYNSNSTGRAGTFSTKNDDGGSSGSNSSSKSSIYSGCNDSNNNAIVFAGNQPIAEGRHKENLPSEGKEPAVPLPNDNHSQISIASSLYSSASSAYSDPRLDAPLSSQTQASWALAFQGENCSLPFGAPLNFGVILPGLYRSSYPKPDNYAFLKRLGLKTIVTLVDKNYTDEYGSFMAANNIQHHMFSMKGTKKEEIPLSTMKAILLLVLNPQNYPLLVHCNHGKHRTGCVAAVVRQIAGWDKSRTIDEYRAFAGRKARDCDVKYISVFNPSIMDKFLAENNLHIHTTTINGMDGSADARPLMPPPAASLGLRIHSFFRATFVSMTVLFIWVISGSKMPPANTR